MAQLWTDQFAPKSVEEFIGNSDLVERGLAWAKAWQAGQRQKPLLFWGQSGAGKTCLAYLLARLHGWQVFELNASDLRSKENIEKYAGGAALNASFSGRLRLVLIDEADGLQARDRGGAAAIGEIVKTAQNPVILTANDVYGDQKMKSFVYACEALEFKKINYLSMAKRLKEVLSVEGAKFDEEAVKELARNASGDMRSALLDAQPLAPGESVSLADVQGMGFREREEKIFKVLEQIFKGKTVEEIRRARFSTDLSNDMLLRWVEENIPRIYTARPDTAAAFERLSKADIYSARILRRQAWEFLRYSGDLMTAGVALSRSQDYHGWLQFRFPGLLSMLSRSKALRGLKTGLCRKIGEKTHSSAREVMAHDLPYLKVLCEDKEKAAELCAQFDFEAEELAFLMDTKADTKKVKDALAKAEELRAAHAKPRSLKPLEGMTAADAPAPRGSRGSLADYVGGEETPEEKVPTAPSDDESHPSSDESRQTRLFG